MISTGLFIAAAHTSDQETAEIRTWPLLPTRASVFYTLACHTLPRWTAPNIYTCLSAKVSGRGKTLYCHLWPV